MVALARNNTDPLSGEQDGPDPNSRALSSPRVMQKLRKAVPNLGLMLYEYQSEPLLKRSDGEIDLGIIALPTDQDGLESRCFTRGSCSRFRRTDARLPTGDDNQVQDLKGQALLLLEDGHCLRDQALEVCSRVGMHGVDFSATSLETLRQMVVAGLGITLLPELAVDAPFGAQRGLATRADPRRRGSSAP